MKQQNLSIINSTIYENNNQYDVSQYTNNYNNNNDDIYNPDYQYQKNLQNNHSRIKNQGGIKNILTQNVQKSPEKIKQKVGQNIKNQQESIKDLIEQSYIKKQIVRGSQQKIKEEKAELKEIAEVTESKQIDKEEKDEIRKKEDKKNKSKAKQLKYTSRELADSAFRTYFGQPPFHTYGHMNTLQPFTLYGEYMKTHNIYPEKLGNNPQFIQVYQGAAFHTQVRKEFDHQPPRKINQQIAGGSTVPTFPNKNTKSNRGTIYKKNLLNIKAQVNQIK